MSNNTQDKGYMTVFIKRVEDAFHLCEVGFSQNPDEEPFYVDYENGTIFIESGDNKSIIGTYETAPSSPYGVKVFDYPSNRVIGYVGNDIIRFQRKEKDYSAGRYSPEEECLAYYSWSTFNDGSGGGNIKGLRLFPTWGVINGSETGGAAAFVALFYNYRFQSVFRDYFTMDDTSFKEKHASYLKPLGY